MPRHPSRQPLPRAQLLAERAYTTLQHFLHIEAAGGVVLLIAAAIALIWANSPLAHSYHALWHTSLGLGLGDVVYARPLHFWINDGLMTLFFLVVGMEIRREIHAGALSEIRQAALPVAAALGGVLVPALVYLAFNHMSPQHRGWSVPTATDIAFAAGVLALLGRSIPANVRVFLLALAIIDDIIAVLIIALFYAGGLAPGGFVVAGFGIVMVLGLQRIGAGAALAYVVPGAVVWTGLLMTGAHPTLAGVVLGLMTPVRSVRLRERPVDAVSRVARERVGHDPAAAGGTGALSQPMKDRHTARRELLPPVIRVQAALHPWVAYGIMPLFALANAGVSVGGIDLHAGGAPGVVIGVALALLVGKPVGIIGVSWLVVRLGWCRLPPGVSWSGVGLIGLLAGIGFTMSMFIAMLAFTDDNLLGAAKLGVLLGSLMAALLGLGWGYACVVRTNAPRASD